MSNENFFHVIKDPVHDTMQFTSVEDNWIKPFIDSPNFQRLRHIKQLGLGDFIFPGAVHSRFNHSLGCAYIASQIANKIGLAEEERQLVIIACLLHDIGHGPFSHAFEDIFQDKAIRHEAWTPFFLEDYKNSAFFETFNHRNPRHHLSEEKFILIENMIMHKSHTKRVLADIVSSQLDADRLDYLLRDNHFCGVKYGIFDLRWMLHCMAIVNSPQGERLGITRKGIGVVEHYLVARRLMTRNIYHSHKKLALEFLLVKFLENLANSIDNYSLFSDIKKTRLGIFLSNVNIFNQQAKNNLEKYKKDFLQQNYQNYKELSDYDIFSVIKLLSEMNDNHPSVQIAKRLQQRQMPKIIRLEGIDEDTIKTWQQSQKHIQPWQIAMIKNPHQSYKVQDDPILVRNENDMARPINEMSLLINAISDKHEETAFLCVDKEIYPELPLKKMVTELSSTNASE